MNKTFRIVVLLVMLAVLPLGLTSAWALSPTTAATSRNIRVDSQTTSTTNVVFLPLLIKSSILESEPNNSSTSASVLSATGFASAIEASIGTAKDVDWYRFNGVAGNTYTIEIYDVDRSLGARGRECNDFTSYEGLWAAVYDPSLAQLDATCGGVSSVGSS